MHTQDPRAFLALSHVRTHYIEVSLVKLVNFWVRVTTSQFPAACGPGEGLNSRVRGG